MWCAAHYSIVDPCFLLKQMWSCWQETKMHSSFSICCLSLHSECRDLFKHGFKVVPLLNQARRGWQSSGVFCPIGLHGNSGACPLAKNPLDYGNEEGLGEFNLILVPDHFQRSSCSLWDTMRPGSSSSRRKDKTPTRRPPVPSKSPQTPKKSQVSSENGLFSGLPSFKKVIIVIHGTVYQH